MNIEREINEALVIIGRARMGKVKCQEALDELWEILINIDYEIRRRNTFHAAYSN